MSKEDALELLKEGDILMMKLHMQSQYHSLVWVRPIGWVATLNKKIWNS